MTEDEEGYSGWTNRETWAVKLHWDNNEGDYRYFTEQAHEFRSSGKSKAEFADFLKEQAEEIQQNVLDGNAGEEAKSFVQDVGSLYRVNWDELADAYYREDEENEEFEKKQRIVSIPQKKPSGWHHEPARHGLAAKGIKTYRKKRR